MRQLIETTLRQLDSEIEYSKEAVELLLGTWAQESLGGKYKRQLCGGPALGEFQCEPNTFNDIINNFLVYKPELHQRILEISMVERLCVDYLPTNIALAICICRVHYLRQKGAIPKDLKGQAEYWKKTYNTFKGKGRVADYIKNYKKYAK